MLLSLLSPAVPVLCCTDKFEVSAGSKCVCSRECLSLGMSCSGCHVSLTTLKYQLLSLCHLFLRRSAGGGGRRWELCWVQHCRVVPCIAQDQLVLKRYFI